MPALGAVGVPGFYGPLDALTDVLVLGAIAALGLRAPRVNRRHGVASQVSDHRRQGASRHTRSMNLDRLRSAPGVVIAFVALFSQRFFHDDARFRNYSVRTWPQVIWGARAIDAGVCGEYDRRIGFTTEGELAPESRCFSE